MLIAVRRKGGSEMNMEILLAIFSVLFGGSVIYAVGTVLPRRQPADPDMKQVEKFIATTPKENLRTILAD